MLRLSMGFTENAEVDEFLHHFVNHALEKRVHDVILCYETKADVNDILYHEEMLKYFCPPNWPDYDGCDDGKIRVLKGLYSLLHSDEEFVPTLVMEYILSKIIEDGMTLFIEDDDYAENLLSIYKDRDVLGDERDKECNVPFTDETYRKIKDAYYEYYLDEISDDTEYALQMSEKMVNSLWHFSPEWYDFCFWDDDYAFLDMYSPGTLRYSNLNKWMRILSEDADEDAFFLPDDWENSKDFHFINK